MASLHTYQKKKFMASLHNDVHKFIIEDNNWILLIKKKKTTTGFFYLFQVQMYIVFLSLTCSPV